VIDLEHLRRQSEQARRLLDLPRGRVHFVGAGGVGMAGLAFLLHRRGLRVDGCDREESKFTAWLQRQGIPVHAGHEASHVAGKDWLVRTGAVSDSHPEVRAAAEHGVPVLLRGCVVGALSRSSRMVAVTGSHGKSTTASMLFQILHAAGVRCGYLGGGWDRRAEGPAAADEDGDELLVVEADESDGTLVTYRPAVGVLTNMEFDHLPAYGSRRAMEEVLRTFAARCSEVFICNADDAAACGAARQARTVLTFGLGRNAAVSGRLLKEYPACELEVFRKGTRFGRLRLPVGGSWNAQNALAALAAALHLGVEFDAAAEALSSFLPVGRRFDHWRTASGVEVVSDYAHHPTEIRHVLAQVRARFPGTVRVVFQPHRYSRTRDLKEEFARVLSAVDHLILTPVFAASEPPLEGGRSRDLAEALRRRGREVEVVDDLAEAWSRVRGRLRPGDVLLILGAGDIEKLVDRVLGELG